ncbi:hypothetical protein PENSPDRAFT_646081 [Peniophora sp. CONT]|nr:hypothetical protein PENSPDRAFT_646081 [Peniophora sp. CONT]
MFKLSDTLLAATVALFVVVGGASAAVTPARRAAAIAANNVDACNGHNKYGAGHSCSFYGGSGDAAGINQGTCQPELTSGVLICEVAMPARRAAAIAANDVDACNGHNNYGVGHSCKFYGGAGDAAGINEGTCQSGASGVLTCVADAPLRRAAAIAPNDVDACNGHNDYGIGHSCLFYDGTGATAGISQGTCQADLGSGALTCVANPARRSIAIAANDVDACNGHNNYGVGHSCKFHGGVGDAAGINEGTCQLDSGAALVCVPN